MTPENIQNRISNRFTQQYMIEVKNKLGIDSDYALAKALHVSKTTVSNYRNGGTAFSPKVCFRVAEILGIHPGVLFSAMEIDRHDGMQSEIDTWTFIYKSTFKAASRLQAGVAHVLALVAVAIVSIAAYAPESRAGALPASISAAQSVYYVKSRADKWAGLMAFIRAWLQRCGSTLRGHVTHNSFQGA